MWSPTHIQVTVVQAKGLLTKGKNETNNCFVTIGLGKEKYQTSIKDKASPNVDWKEECELKIPDQGNRAELVLTALHRNNLGIDEFLGQVTLPLNEMDAYERPRSKWFKLESKPGKEKKNKERGELEVRISFIVKSGSLTDISKKEKHKSSIGQLASSVGGSLLSIGTIEKRKGIKKFAKSLGSKMHLHSKKKNKDGDDISSNGSFSSLGTPNHSNGGGSGRRFGQRAGEADPGVISEDEDEFVFDNLSHKSSCSSINARNSANLQPPSINYVPRNPSPLLKQGGKPENNSKDDKSSFILDSAAELQEIENDFSVRTRTLPAPSKPPRINTANSAEAEATETAQLSEWESKLYGKHLEIGSSDSLKRRSWELSRVPLPVPSEEEKPQPQIQKKQQNSTESSDSSESSEPEEEPPKELKKELNETRPKSLNLALSNNQTDKLASPSINIISPEVEKRGFDDFNASFAKFEQRNSAKIFDLDSPPVNNSSNLNKWNSQGFINKEAAQPTPQPKPRINQRADIENEKAQAAIKAAAEERKRLELLEYEQEQKRLRAEEDARLEAELALNEQRLREEEESLQQELAQQEEQKRREQKRREEDQRILNFAKRSSSQEDSEDYESSSYSPKNQNHKAPFASTPTMQQQQQQQQSQQQQFKAEEPMTDNKTKRLGKFKYSNKRDKSEDRNSSPSPKSNERIIIGHERSATQAERRSEISAALSKKYDGKSREELMLIANGMENEALIQRQRVKELEDYLDNLLLRVMETHPKILQKPYSRTTSAKSG